jgi:hypothetical protein
VRKKPGVTSQSHFAARARPSRSPARRARVSNFFDARHSLVADRRSSGDSGCRIRDCRRSPPGGTRRTSARCNSRPRRLRRYSRSRTKALRRPGSHSPCRVKPPRRVQHISPMAAYRLSDARAFLVSHRALVETSIGSRPARPGRRGGTKSVFGDERTVPVEPPDELSSNGLYEFVRVDGRAARRPGRDHQLWNAVGAVIRIAVFGLPE